MSGAGEYYAEKAEGGEVEGWVPEFPGQRPPFQPGNEAAVRHRAYSQRCVDPVAEELRLAILEDPNTPAHVRSPLNRFELAAMCRAMVQAELTAKAVGECIDRCGGDVVKAARIDGFMSAALFMHRAETRAANARSRLGLNSAAAARLGKHIAQGQVAQADVALRMAQLHEAEQRLLEQGWQPPAGWTRSDAQAQAAAGVERDDEDEETVQ